MPPAAAVRRADARPLYLLVVRPEAGRGAPDGRRLARAIKGLLRCYGLRLVSVELYTPSVQDNHPPAS